MNTLIAIDTETGGFNSRTSPLLSLAAVADDGALFNIKIKPRRVWWRLWRRMKVEAQAVEVNGYTPEAWEEAGAVEIDEAAERFQDWVACRKKERGGRVQVVAHNAGFDRGFVEEMERVTGIGLGLGHRWECSMATLAFLRRVGVFHERGACSLDALCLLAGVTRQEPHDALSDALACFEGYRFMQAAVREKMEGGRTVSQNSTPETDAVIYSPDSNPSRDKLITDLMIHSRRLERQRDEALTVAQELRKTLAKSKEVQP